MRYGVRSEIGQVRRTNQDAYLADGFHFAVADGMGGHQAGEVASRMAVEVLRGYQWSNPETDLYSALQEANRLVWQASLSREEWKGMGTTVTAVVFDGGFAYFGHIGDSRAYLIRGGEITQLTDDHSVVGELVRNGGLQPDEAKYHPQRNILTRALGTEDLVEIDTGKVAAAPGDVFVLCTDGLTAVVDDREIFAAMKDDPQEFADGLIELANGRGGPDNITVVAIAV